MGDSGRPASVLVVDDHDGFRAWARTFLEIEGYRVVGESGTGHGAIESTIRLRPDVVLLDVHLPDIDGFEVARRLARGQVRSLVVLVSSRDPADFGTRSRRADALDVVPKVELSARRLRELLDRRSRV